MKLGEGVEQAIHSVLLLAGLPVDGVLPASALAEYFGVSSSYLLKHLQALAGAGLLLSVPGPKGGYRLAREPAHISLLEIVLAIEGPEPAFRCKSPATSNSRKARITVKRDTSKCFARLPSDGSRSPGPNLRLSISPRIASRMNW